jgi:anti-sigma28 factor (negative regulator of flagellin synthesis)
MCHSRCDNPDRFHDICSTQDAVRDAPDIRQERVAKARRSLRNGTLTLTGEQLAEKLLEDPLHEMQ